MRLILRTYISCINPSNWQMVVLFSLPVEIGFSTTMYIEDEDEGSVTFEVENRNFDREGQYTVQFTTVDGSAVQTTDNGMEGKL